MEDVEEDDYLSTMTLDSLIALPEPCGDEDFDYEQWISEIDTSYTGWFADAYDYYLSDIFPVENGEHGACDYEGVCWTYHMDTDEVCIEDVGCYSPVEALDLYFSQHEHEYDMYSEIEESMLWTMYGEMMNQEMPITDEGEYMAMFYPVYEQKWYELVDKTLVDADW